MISDLADAIELLNNLSDEVGSRQGQALLSQIEEKLDTVQAAQKTLAIRLDKAINEAEDDYDLDRSRGLKFAHKLIKEALS